VALITALLVMMMVGALLAGMFAAVNADLRSHAIDRDQTQVYAAAHAGLEKLTADLAALFVTDFSPNANELDALTAADRLPDIAGFEYTAPGGAEGSGYEISWTPDPDTGDPVTLEDTTITAGPYAGFRGLVTRYDITVTARSASDSEVRLRRGLQTVAIPVFQFGVFSEEDLTFYGGDDFDFGGRVHTNANLWLSESALGTLLFSDRITAWGDVNRRYLSNGLEASTNGMSGPVRILTAIGNPASARTLRYSPNESSVTNNRGGFWTTDAEGEPLWNANGATTNTGTPSWTTVSSTYNGNISNRHTGATVLRLPLTSQGATAVDLIRRPPEDEDMDNAPVFGQRYFSQASLRILLSDRPEDITDLPTVTAAAPVLLDGDWRATPPAGYGPVDATHPPIARAIGPIPATSTVAGSSAPAGGVVATLTVTNNSIAALPAFFRTPTLTVGGNAAVTCTGYDETTNPDRFTGCVGIGVAVILGAPVTATLSTGVTVSTVTTSALAIGAATIQVTNNTIKPFAHNQFWLTTGTTTRLVSCSGYDQATNPDRFIGCSALPAFTAAPGAGWTLSTYSVQANLKGLIGGYIKIEKQDEDGAWTDVTMEILNLGIGAPNQEGTICADPTPDAVIRIQRLRDNGGGTCHYAGSRNYFDWWPNQLYDTREGNYRPALVTTTPIYLGGVMSYVSLDVNNLRRWLAGTIPAMGSTGPDALENNGYIVYFSDRRGDHDETNGNVETGEYGSEDFVNPAVGGGLPVNGTLQTGEDVNGNTVLDTYGQTPHVLTLQQADWTGFNAPFDANANPWDTITTANFPQARINRQVLFRRGLKLVNGGGTNLPDTGLTVVAENPVYVQGNYNASNDPVGNPTEGHAPAEVIGDTVAILSNNWTDANSFRNPNDSSLRPSTTTGYRFAVVTGKSLSFPHPGGGVNFLFGTDGGAGNFLRMMEDWNNGSNLNYRGSMVSLFTSRQGTGTFKYGAPHNVYDYADRNFKFDDEFLQPALLPPGTPMFRDVNLLTFRQILRPNQ
jgi:hypothetical protein